VYDVVLELLDHDRALDTEVKDVMVEALAQVVGQAPGFAETSSAAVFLTVLSVAGFRGVGPAARLDLYSAPRCGASPFPAQWRGQSGR
jgi:hypothetical protein